MVVAIIPLLDAADLFRACVSGPQQEFSSGIGASKQQRADQNKLLYIAESNKVSKC